MYEHLLVYFFIFLIGACIGSFLNVVALRAIFKESIVFPASKCPKCNTPIKWYDNIPIFSYIFTIKGKCRSCGEKVSLQYPIVELLSGLIFLAVICNFGITAQSLLLLVLLCISIVISITDIKEENVYDVHSWILIIASLIYSIYVNSIYFAFIGFLFGAILMEVLARFSYYLIRKNNQENNSDEIKEAQKSDEELNINEYINKKKRAFGEGDTYLAAAVGALLGIKYFVFAIACAIIFQAFCILPQFFINLYKQKQIRLLVSLSSFIVLSALYFGISNIVKLNIYIVAMFVVLLMFFAIDTITRLKQISNNGGFKAIPFGPALLFSAFVMLFWGEYIIAFIKTHIFLISG